ncbi:hypothetical protein [Oceaniradius stylonematis]|uniref:hypothetical protein n=1 Tax=Oceaniradius stylonematis TaxID=2184161 RepID=UPI003B5BBDF1
MGLFDRCEGCGRPISNGEPYHSDWENGIALCEECAPTWQDFKDEPGLFFSPAMDQHHTSETAKPLIDAHIAAGGAMTDKIGLVSDVPTSENCT